MKPTLFISIMLFFLATTSMGQNDKNQEPGRRKLQEEMNAYINKSNREFNEFADRRNREFSDYLRATWKEFKMMQALKPVSEPKPGRLPKYNPEITRIRQDNGGPSILLEIPGGTPASIRRIPNVPIMDESAWDTSEKEPAPSPLEHPKDLSGIMTISFYGEEHTVKYDPALNGKVPSSVNNAAIANMWDHLSKTGYQDLISKLSVLRSQMNLNDWGYYLLVKKTAEGINPDVNYSRVVSWFILTKSGYKVRLAYWSDEIALLFPSVNIIYGLHYFELGNIRFYAPGYTQNTIYTYEKDFPGASKVMDLNIYEPIKIGNEYANWTIDFQYDNKPFKINLEYNKNSIGFYNDFPLCELKLYFDAVATPRFKESVLNAFKQYMSGMTQAESVNFLLSFMQQGFAYKTDIDQFNGKERFFFPEENFYYSYSDCDDRAVLFSYLVKELLHLKIVGLIYPGHVATAIHFDSDEPGDFLLYQGDKYIIADPSYEGAPFGLTMPGMSNLKAEIIDLQNHQNGDILASSIWDQAEKKGGRKGDNRQNIAMDTLGNYYITGYFTGDLTLGGATVTSSKDGQDAFLAKFNKNGKPEWVVNGGCEGNASAGNICPDADGNIYVSGTFEKSIMFGGIIMLANSSVCAYVAKFNLDGKLLWMNQANYDTVLNTDFIYVFSFTREGKCLKTSRHPSDPNFTGFGIGFDERKNVYYTTAYSYSNGVIPNRSYASESTLNVSQVLKEENDRQLQGNCAKAIAGLFGAINVLKNGSVVISGQSVQAAFEIYNPGFRQKSPKLFDAFGQISLMKNDLGIITIQTQDQKPIYLDRMKINNGTRIKATFLSNCNARLDIMGGVKVGKSIIWFNLNYMKLNRYNGSILFDYDSDHSQVTIDVKKDLL